MTDQILTEWFTEWNHVKDTEREKVSKFAESILSNEDVFQAITHVLEETERFKPVSHIRNRRSVLKEWQLLIECS